MVVIRAKSPNPKKEVLSPQRPPIGRLLVDMGIIDYKTFESCLDRLLDARQKHSTDWHACFFALNSLKKAYMIKINNAI